MLKYSVSDHRRLYHNADARELLVGCRKVAYVRRKYADTSQKFRKNRAEANKPQTSKVRCRILVGGEDWHMLKAPSRFGEQPKGFAVKNRRE
jgi:hypothetical protein